MQVAHLLGKSRQINRHERAHKMFSALTLEREEHLESETLLDAGKLVGLEVNAKRSKFCLLFYMGVKLGLSQYGKHRLRVSENRALRRIFGPNRYNMAGGWRKFHSDALRNSYFSPNIIRIIRSRRRDRRGT
jgi:hypothetical protein